MSDTQNLYAKFASLLPSNTTAIVKTSIEAFSELLGCEEWRPKQTSFSDVLGIIQLGFSLSLISATDSLGPLRRKIASAILLDQAPSPSDLAEINAAALCVALGATSLEKVKTGPTKTPDFIASWSPEENIDIEVTCARTKPAHVERRRIAMDIAQRLHSQNGDRTWDLIIHNADPSNEQVPAIIDAARNLEPGMVAEQINVWDIRAEIPDRDPYTLVVAGNRDKLPTWWPPGTVAPFIFHGFVAGPNAIAPPPQVRVTYGVPLDSYINPVQNKADDPQGGTNNPFIIAVDVSELPGAFRVFRQDLPKFFSFWKNISAVLLFQPFTHPSKVGWFWELIPNAHGSALSSELLAKQTTSNNFMETGVCLMET